MICKFRIFLAFLFCSCLLSNKMLLAQGPDSVFIVPNNPFIKKLASLKDLNTTFFLSRESDLVPLKNSFLSANAQKLIKNGPNLYVTIEQTGFIYQLTQIDTNTCKLIRLDHTVNLNYNINCINFFYKNQLFSYGGYGFWKTNGHLRKFNFEDSEWDIIPCDQEIIATNYQWFSEATGRFYTPVQRIVNAGIEGPDYIRGKPIYTSYYLDLNSNKWIKLGELEPEIKKLIQDDYTSGGFLPTKEGLLHLVHDELYFLDYNHNKVYKSTNADLNQFLIRRANMANMFVYNGFIYSYNTGANSFNTYPLRLNDFELLRSSIWGMERQLYYVIVSIVLIVVLILVFIWFFNRSVKRKLEVAQLKILKTKSVSQAFTGTEVALIQLLLSASLKNNNVEIHQINHVLGIKDKNIGLQKKVRSDVINAINDKYEFIAQSSNVLIGSSRKEDDKRFFEYFITPSEIKSIQRILENN